MSERAKTSTQDPTMPDPRQPLSMAEMTPMTKDNQLTQKPAERAVVMDAEVAALATAYHAIRSQPFEAHERMLKWLTDRLADDASENR